MPQNLADLCERRATAEHRGGEGMAQQVGPSAFRMKAGPRALSELPSMLIGLALSEVEVVEPLPIEFGEGAVAAHGKVFAHCRLG